MTKDEKIVDDYFKFRVNVTGMAESTANTRKPTLNKFLREIQKPIKKITETDIINFLNNYKSSTRNSLLSSLRNFLQWHYNLDKKDKLPDCIKRIQFIGKKQEHRNGEFLKKRERIVHPNEYIKLIETATDIKHKAIIETLYLYGIRVSEMLSMTSDGIKEQDGLTVITVWKSKTQARDVPINEYPQYLLEWYHTYQPFRNQKDKPLWVSNYSGNINQTIKKNSINRLLERLTKRASMEKHISPHDFRHTSISRDLVNGMPQTLIETKYGLIHGTRQLQVYDHNQTKELEEYLTKQPIDNPETYQSLKKVKETLEQKHENEIDDLKEEIKNMKKDLETYSAMVLPLYQKRAIKEFNENPDKQLTSFDLDD